MSAAVAIVPPDENTPSAPVTVDAPTPGESAALVGLRLAAFSGLILFFELALIRYSAAYVRVFGF
jgi:hypothetical protein